MIRSIAAIIAGLLPGLAVVLLLRLAEMRYIKAPPGMRYFDPRAARDALAHAPARGLILILIVRLGGVFVGAALAAFIARSAHHVHALLVAFFLLLASICNLLAITHPLWYWLATLFLTFPIALLGAVLARPNHPPGSANPHPFEC